MKASGRLKLIGQLLDLPLIDSDGNYCGIVDDLEFEGAPGKKTRLAAVLVGPGTYAARMPGWMMWLVRMMAGDRVTRVPVDKIESIKSVVQLKSKAEALGLNKTEDRVGAWIPRAGAW
jgi:sporulation protein YlmC with PRC-barrel domain